MRHSERLPTARAVDVIGAGLAIPNHLTLESLQSLTQAEVLYTILDVSLVRRLPLDFSACRVVQMMEFYSQDRPRRANYEEAVVRIVDAVTSGFRTCYLTFGNPVMYDSVTQGLLHVAEEGGFTVRVLPGISFIDTVLIDARVDIGEGVQIHDATALVQQGVSLDPRVTVILAQPGVFENEFMLEAGNLRTSLTRLMGYLRRWYPNEHRISLITSHHLNGADPVVAEMALRDLPSAGLSEGASASLVLPAVRPNDTTPSR